MRHRSRLREDDRLADERAALRPADVEHIRQPRDVRERHIVRAAAERVRQARAVKEERHAVCAADFADGGQLRARVERAVLRRVRDIDHAGHHHVVAVLIVRIGRKTRSDSLRREFPVHGRQREYLVPAALDRASLVQRDVSRLRRNDALIGAQHRRNHRHVRLRPACEEVDFRIGRAARCADFFTRRLGKFIAAVARRLHHIRLDETLQNRRVRPLHIVRRKAGTIRFTHWYSSIPCVHYMVLRSKTQCCAARSANSYLNSM